MLSSEESEHNARYRVAGGAPHPCHSNHAPHSQFGNDTHEVNIAVAFGQKMSPAWVYHSKLPPAVTCGPNHGSNVKCLLRRDDGKEHSLYAYRGNEALIRCSHQIAEAKRKLALAARSRLAQA